MINTNIYNYINVLDKAADAANSRNEILSNNIANVDTPNYKRKDVAFENYLEQALIGPESLDDRIADVNTHLSDFGVMTYTDHSTLSYRLDCNNLDILDKTRFPLLADTLEQTLIYYHLRMKVEKELVDIFQIQTDSTTMLNQIIQRAFRCQNTDPKYEQMREFRVFFTSRKTLLNEFNHFEGNMNIFQPAIDITKSALQKEIDEIEAELTEVRSFMSA